LLVNLNQIDQMKLSQERKNWFWEQSKKYRKSIKSIRNWSMPVGVALAIGLGSAIADEQAKTILEKVSKFFESAETMAIVGGVVLYLTERHDRKQRKHYEAWQVIDAAQGIKTSYARIKALEDLNEDGVSLEGLDLSNTNLRGINLRFADLSYTNLSGADLYEADLSGANLFQADLNKADMSEVDLNNASLVATNLNCTNLSNADLTNASLIDTELNRTNLFEANLSNASLKDSLGNDLDLKTASLCSTIMPDGKVSYRDCPDMP
jgi:hypothetical protein